MPLLLAAGVTCAACHDSRPAPAAVLEGESDEVEVASASCTPGDRKECHETLATHNGVVSCYDGFRVCDRAGRYGACGSGETVSLVSPDNSAARLRLKAVTVASDCDGNPCDPSCRAFPEVPAAASSDNVLIESSPFDWETGSLGDLPGGLVNKGLVEPCASGADCQFNTQCINPITDACAHDKCAAGEALTSDCDSCVEAICVTAPECCTGYTGGCTHDLGEVGLPLKASCDACVRDICETAGFEYCCEQNAGSWDSGCIAEVENTCGGAVGCCEGEVAFGDGCYYVETDSMTWSEARASCQERGLGWDLVSIGSSSENELLYNLNDNDHTWIGLTSGNGLSTGNDWVWSNGNPAGAWRESTRSGHPFNEFASGEPDNNEDCARMNEDEDGAWDGKSCSSDYESFCEGPPRCRGGSQPSETVDECEHDPCRTGTPLKSNCDVCVQAVCATDASCCDEDEAWTDACIALLATECTATCECASDEQTFGGHCYFLQTNSTTWSNALTACRSRGSAWDLVSIGDAAENTHIRGMNGSEDTWIGFTELSTYGGSNDKWVWTNADPSGYWRENGQVSGVTYRNWSSGEPDDSGECSRMKANSNGQWADRACSSSYDYICEGKHGSTLSELVPVVSTSGSSGGTLYGSGGGSEDIGEWTEECAALVGSVCDAQCGAPVEQGQGTCLPWYPGQSDENCSGVDVAVGVPCGESIPVCNHGQATVPAGVRLIHFPANSNQYPKCDPDQTHPQMYECFTEQEIAPGTCINVTNCPHLVGNREIMVNPAGSAHIDECSCLDNWSLYSGGECGPPVCSGGTNAATLSMRPVDIIVTIDNSGSMQGEIVEIQRRINEDFAQIIQDSGVDYRVIMVSRYGNVYITNYNGGSSSTSAYAICLGPPLSDLTCPATLLSSTPAVAHKSPRFFHHSTDIGSHDLWCKLTASLDAADPYPSARSGFVGIAADGWRPYLREEAFKIFVAITDDSPDTNSSGSSGQCLDSSGLTNDAAGAENFDEAIRGLAPEHFGAYNAMDPDLNRNYAWYSIVGMAGNAITNPTPLEANDPIETRCCRGDGTIANSCPNSGSAPDSDGVGNGRGYQELSKMTGGLRFSSCYNSDFNDVFNAIAAGVIQGARVSCDFTLQNAGSFDINTARVLFQEDADAEAQELSRADDLAECSTDGWYLPDVNAPEQLALCPSACEAAQQSADSRLSVEVGCLGSGYEPYSFTEVYGAECRYDQVPQWGFLSIEATTPGDTSVGLRARAATTEAGLAAAEFVEIATLSSDNGNSLCSAPNVAGCPIDVFQALGGAPLSHAPFIEFEVSMTPTSDGSALPSVDAWSITYSCLDSE